MTTSKTVRSLAGSAFRALRLPFVLVLPCWSACLAPPAILPSTTLPLDTVAALYPPESQFLLLGRTGREPLHAVFVPAEEGSPVVLHLLDSSGSFGGMGTDLGVVAHQLRDLGLASLFFDYTGVGLSSGRRSVENLRADAVRAWDEALARAGGDPQRVVVRAISIGTIAAAELVASGARPRAVLALSPVLPDTVVQRFAREFHGWPAWLFASLAFRPVTRLDPCAVIEASGVPWHMIGSADDPLLSKEEVARLGAAASASGGGWHERGGGHVFLGVLARWIGSEELKLFLELTPRPQASKRVWAELLEGLRPRFPEGSEERKRLEQLALTQRHASAFDVAAAALANADWITSWHMLWLTRIRPYPSLGFDDLVAALSLRSPTAGGELPVVLIEFLSAGHDLAWRYERSVTQLSPSAIASVVSRVGQDGERYDVEYRLRCGLEYTIQYDLWTTWLGLLLQQPAPWEADVALARSLLKSMRIPDRVRVLPDGSILLEAFWEESWEPVRFSEEPAEEPPKESSAGPMGPGQHWEVRPALHGAPTSPRSA